MTTNGCVGNDDLEFAFGHAGGVWDSFRNARIFLTGGTGFVGKWLLETLLYANDRLALNVTIVTLTRDQEAFRAGFPWLASHPAVTLHRGDVRTFEAPEGRFSHVVHAATDVVQAPSPLDTFDVTVSGTRRVLEFAVSAGAAEFLLVSSGAVYGPQAPALRLVAEGCCNAPDSLDVRSAYGLGKRGAEWLATAYGKAHGMRVRTARCFAFVGPLLALDKHFAVGNFIGDALAGRAIQIGGDGTTIRSYLYAADLATWLWTILVRGTPGVAYNVGSDEAISIADLARRVVAQVNPALEIRIAREPQSGSLPDRYVPDVGLARRELGLDVWTGLDSAILRTVAWHLQERNPQ
ncbi:NAD-dependent epimerase/dehydratase family protein [Niveibacterium sp. 24ML]|uniref:NAD-dependent epimerase/dehydratase family protein n=1 Tax=Niveibacterium sp. 24ML TaxID=2985512 RepID=UPI00226FD762|nr:NAD-dependent epimerase/dehydratase family protein [Niveibacterium sp. 24ML]MCX9158357.1 NAD-dependent epimerase/dehydratase family protein [Niveibacterium sp. 24ML]